MTRGITVKSTGQGRTIAIVGDIYRFLATGDDTGGKYAMWEATVLPGGGPPPHVHRREEEAFYVLEGEVTFTVDGKRMIAAAGTFVNVPIGVPHSFKNETGKAMRMIISIAPAGLEKMFFEIGTPLPEGATSAEPPSEEEIKKLIALAPSYGIELLLPAR